MKYRQCSKCRKETPQRLISIPETIPINDVAVTIYANKYKCTACGLIYEDDHLKEHNMALAIKNKAKSEYAQLTDYAFIKLGDLNWGLFGSLHKKYNSKFIKECIDKIPENKKLLSSVDKTLYLAGICKNNSQPEDVKNSKVKINIKGFGI